jgi:DNA-binding MarR family transcriptional regulator
MKIDHDASHEIIITIRRIIRAIEIHSKRLEREFGLTVPQLLVLKEIGARRDVPAARLAEVLSVSQATITTIIDRLERHGFVDRVRSTKDKRVIFICPTSKTTEVLARNPSVIQERFVKRLGELEEWERTLILSSIQRIATMMKAEELKASPILVIGSHQLLEGANADGGEKS